MDLHLHRVHFLVCNEVSCIRTRILHSVALHLSVRWAMFMWFGLPYSRRWIFFMWLCRSCSGVLARRTNQSVSYIILFIYLFIYLLTKRYIQMYCHVQTEQDNKARITGTDSCTLSVNHTATYTNTMQCISKTL